MTDDRLLAYDQVPFILAVCEGPDLRVLSLSAATRAVLPGREFLGLPIRDVLSDLVGQQWVDNYYEVYRTGEPITGREWRAHLTAPDGSVHEMYANFTITPWTVDGELRGVIGVGFDVTELVRQRQAAADEAAGLQRRYEQSLEVTTALQRELLPAGLPVLPGAQIAASYLVADAGTAAGGDWFDAIVQRDGRVALIVGDVVGHGVTASGVMGQLRAVLQDRLDDSADVATALAAADRFARRVPAAHAATICVAVLDPVSGALAYCTAGHPPPLLLAAGGEPRYLPGTGGAPLGTGGAFPVATHRLDHGDVLLLYTDGILERPGRTHPVSAAELAQTAADSAAGRALHDPGATAAERVCTQTVELLVRAAGHQDDITLLAVERVALPGPLVLSLPADPSVLSTARVELAGWLGALGATDTDTFALQHAIGELMTNAIEHATGASTVEIHLELGAAGAIEGTVTDHGQWQAPSRQPTRGRGLAMAAQLMDSLRVEPGVQGTVARIRHALTRPARLLALDFPAPATPAVPASTFRVTEEPGGDETRVRLEGPLDLSTASLAEHELLRRARGGMAGLTVDLSAVTVLSSAGVSMLHRLAERHAGQKMPLTVDAAPGSPAAIVLSLVALLDRGYPQGES